MRLDRQELIDILRSWAQGRVTAPDVDRRLFEMVETFRGEWPDIREDDPRIIPLEVVRRLHHMDRHLITPKDVPAILGVLQTEEGREAEALKAWREYFTDERWYQRKREILEEFGPHSWYFVTPDLPEEPW